MPGEGERGKPNRVEGLRPPVRAPVGERGGGQGVALKVRVPPVIVRGQLVLRRLVCSVYHCCSTAAAEAQIAGRDGNHNLMLNMPDLGLRLPSTIMSGVP